MGIAYAEVIGDPIAHSKSPLIHKFWLEKLGIEGDYRSTRVHYVDLGDYFGRRRLDPDWRGCNITSPHKTQAIDHLDNFAPEAVAVGAINCVYRDGERLVGTNTDVDGVDEVLDLYPWTNRMVTLIGSGGGARAVLEVLRRRGTLETFMVARNPDDARSLHRSFARSGAVYSFANPGISFSTSELVVNATPLGMAGMPPMPVAVLDELSKVSEGATVFDMVYAPVQTELLKRAGQLSLNTVSGFQMLLGQARRAFECFFGATAPREHDAELLEVLTQ